MRDAGSFTEVAASLREELLAQPGFALGGPAAMGTVETNSDLVERRGRPLVDIVRERRRGGAPRGRRVIDLGCGFGALSALFAFEGAKVVGVDSKPARLEIGRRVAARHGLAVELRQGRMEQLDFADASFDVAVMNNSLVYLVDRAQRLHALREARRVLVPGGIVVLRNANRLHPVDQFTGIPLIHLLPPAHAVRTAELLGTKRSLCRVQSPGATRRELLAAGFAAPVHHAAVARKPRVFERFARYTHLSALRPCS